jgi:hypothetical protein
VRPLLTAFALIAALALPGRQAQAHDAYSDAESNPLKIASYPVAAAGFVLEWLVTRPVHFVVSQPTLQNVFSYEPAYNAFDTPEPYLPSRHGTSPEPFGAQVVTPDDAAP